MTGKAPTDTRLQEVKRLIAEVPLIFRSACELDLLVFLYRHPRALLTNEQLAKFIGYGRIEVASGVDAFIVAGLLERTQNRTHAARMYILSLEGPQGRVIKALLDLASTRSGRQQILEHIDGNQSSLSFPASREKIRANA